MAASKMQIPFPVHCNTRTVIYAAPPRPAPGRNLFSEMRFFAKGAVAVQKLGPFQTLKITGILAGRSEDSAEAVDDERTSVFVLDGDTLTLGRARKRHERAVEKGRVGFFESGAEPTSFELPRSSWRRRRDGSDAALHCFSLPFAGGLTSIKLVPPPNIAKGYQWPRTVSGARSLTGAMVQNRS